MRYFLALDAGGTKTACVLADEERELARVRSGTIKVLRADVELARHNLEQLLSKVVQQSGVDLRSISRTCIGTSGASVPFVTKWIHDNLQSRVSGEVEICGDEVIALDAAFQGGSGVLVIAGTGSNIVGRSLSGQLAGAGGTGPILADEGSGHWIGHQALRRAFRALDERRPTELINDVLRFWKLPRVEDLIGKANATDTPDFSTLTPIVVAAAERGDQVAQEVLQWGGEELARMVLLVMERLVEIDGLSEDNVPGVAFTGSVVKNVLPLRFAMIGALKRKHPTVHILAEAVDPVQGALWRARHAGEQNTALRSPVYSHLDWRAMQL
jgi:N-acetylglucosamine kinase-like BadF-type ATPase